MGTGGRVQVEVLGPVRVFEPGGRDLTPSGALQRRLLALLVLRRGRVVSVAASDVLWPSKLPRDPVGALHNHLSRLRQKLPADLIESIGDGYRIDPATYAEQVAEECFIDARASVAAASRSVGAHRKHAGDSVTVYLDERL